MGGVGCAAFGQTPKRSYRFHTVAAVDRPNCASHAQARPVRTSHGRRERRRNGGSERGRITHAPTGGSRPSTVSFADSRQTTHSISLNESVFDSERESEALPAPHTHGMPPAILEPIHSKSQTRSRTHRNRHGTILVNLPDKLATPANTAHSVRGGGMQQRPTTQPSPQQRNTEVFTSIPRPSTVMGTMGNIGHECAPSATRAAAHAAVTHPKPRQAIDGTVAPWNGTVPDPVRPSRTSLR